MRGVTVSKLEAQTRLDGKKQGVLTGGWKGVCSTSGRDGEASDAGHALERAKALKWDTGRPTDELEELWEVASECAQRRR